jgi:hypothetical protein
MRQEYPENWDRIRRRVYRRDDYTCQNCGTVGGAKGNAELHAHHIIPRSQAGSDQPKNLTTLCQACHSQLHGRQVGSKKRQTADSDSNDVISTAASIILTILTIIITVPVAIISNLLGWGFDFWWFFWSCFFALGILYIILYIIFVGVE